LCKLGEAYQLIGRTDLTIQYVDQAYQLQREIGDQMGESETLRAQGMTFWQVGRAQTSGLMVLGDDAAYGVEVFDSRSRETVFKPGANAYRPGVFRSARPTANRRELCEKDPAGTKPL
jgi:hypothetical protein